MTGIRLGRTYFLYNLQQIIMDRNDVDKLEYKFKSIAYEEVKIIVIIL